MKKLIVVALAATTLLIPATADASTRGATRAVNRELRWEGYESALLVPTYCYWRHRGYYTCKFDVLNMGGENGNYASGRARVWQYGRRYYVDYRINW